MFGIGKKIRVLKEALVEGKAKDKDGFVCTSTDRCSRIVEQLNPVERQLKAYMKELNSFKPTCQELLNHTRGVSAVLTVHTPLGGDTTPADTLSPAQPALGRMAGMDPMSAGGEAHLDNTVTAPCERWLSEFHIAKEERMPAMEKVRLELDSRRRQEVELKDNVDHLQSEVMSVVTDPAKHSKHNKKYEDAAHLLAHKQTKMFGTSKTFEDQEAALYQHLRALAEDSDHIPAYMAAILMHYRDMFDRALEAFPPESLQLPSASALESSNHHELWRRANTPNLLPPVLPEPVPAVPFAAPPPAIPFETVHTRAVADASDNHGAMRDITQDRPFVRAGAVAQLPQRSTGTHAAQQYDVHQHDVHQHDVQAPRDDPAVLPNAYAGLSAPSPTPQYDSPTIVPSSQHDTSGYVSPPAALTEQRSLLPRQPATHGGQYEAQFQHAPAPAADTRTSYQETAPLSLHPHEQQQQTIAVPTEQFKPQYATNLGEMSSEQHMPVSADARLHERPSVVFCVDKHEGDVRVPPVSQANRQQAGVTHADDYDSHRAGSAPENPRNPYLQKYADALAPGGEFQAGERLAAPPALPARYDAHHYTQPQYKSSKQDGDGQQQYAIGDSPVGPQQHSDAYQSGGATQGVMAPCSGGRQQYDDVSSKQPGSGLQHDVAGHHAPDMGTQFGGDSAGVIPPVQVI